MKRTKIFVIEDDATIAELLQVALEHEGYAVHIEPRGDLAALDESYALVLLDLMLPEADGLALARRIRGAYGLPIIMVTARGSIEDKVRGFEAGADDYMAKPFSFAELAVRIRALLFRTGRGGTRVEAGPLLLELEQRQASWQGRPLELTAREFDLLVALARRPGRVYQRDELRDRVWGFDFSGESNVVEVTVRRLRERLGDEGHRVIATVRGVGYTLRLP